LDKQDEHITPLGHFISLKMARQSSSVSMKDSILSIEWEKL